MYLKSKIVTSKIFISIKTKVASKNIEENKPRIKDIHKILRVKNKISIKIKPLIKWNLVRNSPPINGLE